MAAPGRESQQFEVSIRAIRAARVRAPDQPTLAERKAFADNPAALKRLRKVWGDPTIAAAVQDVFQHAKQAHRSVGAAAGAIAQTFPSHLAEKIEVVKLARGVLTLGVPDSSTRYVVDRLLRTGAQTALLKRVPASVRSVKMVMSSARGPGESDHRRDPPIEVTQYDAESGG
ncbi:MAG: hypothetical protein KF869_05810 [Phycisphaeraceae bacterium]|nr:hypothetical protein [Phycisphaeraceae bacterium]